MGIASGDFDGDGDEDLFVTNIVGETFALYVNDGHGNFEDPRRVGPGARRRRVHRLRHRLVRLRQRRLARSVRRQRRGEHHRSAARAAVSVPDEEPAVPQPGNGRFAETTLAGGRRSRSPRSAAAPRSATSTTMATPTSSSPTTAARFGCCSTDRRQVTGSMSLSQDSGNRFGLGARVGIERAGRPTLWRRVQAPTAVTCRQAIRAHTLDWGTRPRSTLSSSNGRTAMYRNAGPRYRDRPNRHRPTNQAHPEPTHSLPFAPVWRCFRAIFAANA